ncbi:MAG: rhamnogalacturonan acetylesterase [Planctomycetales bacterium]|nr:rhamnogalacturonan acetylesterase [Planctomycetales bacterium]
MLKAVFQSNYVSVRSWIITLLLCLAAPAADPPPTIYVAGDSTAAFGTENAQGWGRHFGSFFDEDRVRIVNLARGGRSSRTFVTEGHWQKIVDQLRAEDVVLIQFGHNDGGPINDSQRARGSLPGLGDETQDIDNQQTGQSETVHSYGWYLTKMIEETRTKNATPILMTLTVRNIWNDGQVERGSGNYNQWMAELANKHNVRLIDHTRLIADHYEQQGQTNVAPLFPKDHTHTNATGAQINASLAVAGFQGLREASWNHWLNNTGRTVNKANPKYVQVNRVRRKSEERDEFVRWLNLPEPADHSLPNLWLIGDSTVRTGRGTGDNGQFGWGDPIESYFDRNRINVVNRAVGGTGVRTYRSIGYWEVVLPQIKAGDVVIIQFGHNDNGQRGALRGVGSETESRNLEDGGTEVVESFGSYLRKFVTEIRSKQATPVICSLIPRKIWNEGKIVRSNQGHAAWAKQVAEETETPFVDLYELIATRYDALGPTAVDPLFADQRVHTSWQGARLNAACVVEGLSQLPTNPVAAYQIDSPKLGQEP